MKPFTFVRGCLLALLIAPAAHAQNSQTTVPLYRGQGVTLNFRPTGETIQRAWLDDPSQTTLDFDDTRCSASGSEGCAASVIHLRRINPISFPGLPTGTVTGLTVLTNGGLYSFQLTFPDSGSPSYSILDIQPERESLQSSPRAASSQLTQAESLAAIEQGLNISLARGFISTGDPLWQRTQTFLALMRDGVSSTAAAQRAGVSQPLILRLIELGARPQTPSPQTPSI